MGIKVCLVGVWFAVTGVASAGAAEGPAKNPPSASAVRDSRPTEDAAACRAGFSVDNLMNELGKNKLPPRGEQVVRGPALKALFEYFQVKAFLARDSTLCGGLESLGLPTNGDRPAAEECRLHYNETLVGHAMYEGPGTEALGKACNAVLCRDGPLPYPDIHAMCAIVVQDYRNPKQLCARVVQVKKHMKVPECERFWRQFSGDETACGNPADMKSLSYSCEDYAAFGKARRAGKIALCGDSGLCLAMMGEGSRGLQIYSDKIRDLYCGDRPGTLSQN